MSTAIALLLSLNFFASHGNAGVQSSVSVEKPWARASIGASRPAAAFLTLVNNGSETAYLIEVESSAADRADVHRTVKEDDGVVRMEPAGDVRILPGERVVLAPGGLHIMMMDLVQSLDVGESLELYLRFADDSETDVIVPIINPGAKGPDG